RSPPSSTCRCTSADKSAQRPSGCRRRTCPARRSSPGVRSQTPRAPPSRSSPSQAPQPAPPSKSAPPARPSPPAPSAAASCSQARAAATRSAPRRRNRQPPLAQLVRYPHLTPRRLLQRQLHHRLLDLRRHPILQVRLPARHLLQRELSAFLVQLLEPVEAVARVTHDLAGLAHVPQLLRQLQQAQLRSNDLLHLRHRRFSSPVVKRPTLE